MAKSKPKKRAASRKRAATPKKKVAAKRAASKKSAKGTVVAKTAVKRKSGYLYFVDGEGNVRESKMNRKGGKPGRKVCRG